MLAIYNTASICGYNDPFHCGLRLQPDLAKIMAKSRNWEELAHVWTEWRRNSGQKMKDTYEQMIRLSNQAARANSKLLSEGASLHLYLYPGQHLKAIYIAYKYFLKL